VVRLASAALYNFGHASVFVDVSHYCCYLVYKKNVAAMRAQDDDLCHTTYFGPTGGTP